MSLSRKHYCAVAAIIAPMMDCEDKDEQFVAGAEACAYRLAWELSNYFASDNPQFDRARFLAACKAMQS